MYPQRDAHAGRPRPRPRRTPVGSRASGDRGGCQVGFGSEGLEVGGWGHLARSKLGNFTSQYLLFFCSVSVRIRRLRKSPQYIFGCFTLEHDNTSRTNAQKQFKILAREIHVPSLGLVYPIHTPISYIPLRRYPYAPLQCSCIFALSVPVCAPGNPRIRTPLGAY